MFGALAAAGIGAAAKFGLDYAKGHASNQLYASRIRDQAKVQYAYAQRYAENSPSWNVKGLREAGLNPILAVSNGVNLGANMPNLSSSSPDMDSGSAPDLAGIIQNKQRLDIDRENSASSRISADAQATSAGASLLQAKTAASRAESQNKLDAAETALKVIEAEKARGSKYDSPIMRDAEKLMNNLVSPVINKFGEKIVQNGELSYLNHSPKPLETRTEYQKRMMDKKPVDEDSRYYRSRRTIDNMPIYRRRREYYPGNVSVFR